MIVGKWVSDRGATKVSRTSAAPWPHVLPRDSPLPSHVTLPFNLLFLLFQILQHYSIPLQIKRNIFLHYVNFPLSFLFLVFTNEHELFVDVNNPINGFRLWLEIIIYIFQIVFILCLCII